MRFGILSKANLRRQMIGKYPRSINIELTSRCNLKCQMCPRSTTQYDGGDMDFDLFKKTINQASVFVSDKTAFTLVGLGEPLIYPKLREAIEHIKAICPQSNISFATNGTLLSGSISKMLNEVLNERDGILVSLNTNNTESYIQLMNADKFELVTSNIKNFLSLQNRRVPIKVQFLDTKNGEGIGEFKARWEPQLTNKDRIFIRPLVNWNGKIDMSSFPSRDKKERYPCLALWTSISIDRNGNIYPCCEAFASRETSPLLLGNIHDGSLLDIYNNEVTKIRDNHLHEQWGACSSCDMWSASPNVWVKARNRWY